MKRNWFIAIVLIMALTVLCTACGGGNNDGGKEPAETTGGDLPSVTAPPASGSGDETKGLAADDNTAPGMINREDWLASLSEEQRMVEEELRGATVEELYEAIGEPISAEYSASCLVADGEDGVLEYDGFKVSTTRLSNGAEYVMGTYND